MTSYVIRRNRPGPSLLDEAYAILRKDEAKAKKAAKEPAPTPAKPPAKKAAAKKKASKP